MVIQADDLVFLRLTERMVSGREKPPLDTIIAPPPTPHIGFETLTLMEKIPTDDEDRPLQVPGPGVLRLPLLFMLCALTSQPSTC